MRWTPTTVRRIASSWHPQQAMNSDRLLGRRRRAPPSAAPPSRLPPRAPPEAPTARLPPHAASSRRALPVPGARGDWRRHSPPRRSCGGGEGYDGEEPRSHPPRRWLGLGEPHGEERAQLSGVGGRERAEHGRTTVSVDVSLAELIVVEKRMTTAELGRLTFHCLQQRKNPRADGEDRAWRRRRLRRRGGCGLRNRYSRSRATGRRELTPFVSFFSSQWHTGTDAAMPFASLCVQ